MNDPQNTEANASTEVDEDTEGHRSNVYNQNEDTTDTDGDDTEGHRSNVYN